MKSIFYKYQGTGNDFILLDNRNLFFDKTDSNTISKMCHRKFGIGADGLILLEKSAIADFKMRYFNADGKKGSMCGNGGRCIVHFANFLNIIKDSCVFEAPDGLHKATINKNIINLQMANIENVNLNESNIYLNTGSPHHIALIKNLNDFDVYQKGKEIRYGAPYFAEGTNVNFVEQTGKDSFKMRTYERGVENETLSCGTGATAVAIAMNKINKTESKRVFLETLGGKLEVSFDVKNGVYTNVFLKGKVEQVFKGEYQLP